MQEASPDLCSIEETGDSDCEGNESAEPVGLLTGDKIERNTDLVVKLPGRDFELVREYTSKIDYYYSDSNGEYYWNGDSTTVVPGFIGVNWSANVFSMILGDNGSSPQNLTLVGTPLRTVRRFSYDLTTDSHIGMNANNQYIIETTTNVAGLNGSIPVWRVIEPGGVERDYVRNDAQGSPSIFDKDDIIGRLVRERDTFGNEHFYEWFGLYTPTGGVGRTPRLKYIHLNASVNSSGVVSGALARVDFLWHGQSGTDYEFASPNEPDSTNEWYYGRVAEVQVRRDDGSQDWLVTQKVKYTYFDEWDGLKEFGQETALSSYDSLEKIYDATHGDLCEVVQSVRINNDVGTAGDADDFYDRVTQYRYHGNSVGSGLDYGSPDNTFELEFDGEDHQLLAVIYPDQIEYFADHYNQLADGNGSAYGEVASVTEAARRLRWIRFDEDADATSGYYFHDPNSIFLPGTYWNSLHQIVSKIIDYYPTSGTESDYRVRTQIVNAGGATGCGCSGPSGSEIGKRYDYIYTRYNWQDSVGGIPTWLSDELDITGADGYSCQIVESYAGLDSSQNADHIPYRVYSHDYYWPSNYEAGHVNGTPGVPEVGLLIHKVMSVVSEADPLWEPTSSTIDPYLDNGKHWITFQYYDHSVDPLTGEFTNYGKLTRRVMPSAIDYTTYDPAHGTTSPDVPDMHTNEGLVYDYGYVNGWLSTVSVKQGTSGTAEVVSETDHLALGADRPDLRDNVERNAGGGVVETTEYAYEYHNISYTGTSADDVLSMVRVKQTRESAAQNGPGETANPERYTLFNQNGQVVWSRDPDEVLVYNKYDADTGALVLRVRDADPSGTYVASGDAINSTNFPGAFTPASASSYEELTDEYEVDLLGRVVKHTDPGGVESYYRYELQETDLPDASTGSLVDRGVPMYTMIRLPHVLSNGDFDGPITKTWVDAADRTLRSSSYIASDGGGTYNPLNDVYAEGDEVQRSDSILFINGLVKRRVDWHSISSFNALSGAFETNYEYDPLGRISKVTDPEDGVMQYGDSTNVGYDIFDRPISVFSGTTSGVSLISKTYYDSDETSGVPTATQGVGNGVVRRVESHPGEGSTRVVNRWYDYRDRLIAQENPEAPHQVYAYDNLNRVIEQASFTGGVFEDSASADLYEPVDTGPSVGGTDTRSTYILTHFNNRGLVYKTQTAIDPSQSSPTYLESNSWFDLDGNVIASWSPNSAATKYEYDALDRPSVVYQTDRDEDGLPGEDRNGDLTADDPSYNTATTLTDDHVISQVEYGYIGNGDPGAGQVELVTNRMRHHDAKEANPGEVTGALTTSDSVTTYTGYVYDDAGRQTDTLSYGTNDSGGFNSSTSAPTTPFNTTLALVSSVEFDEWGRVVKVIDPEGKITLTVYDDLSRTIATIENQVVIDGDDISPSSGNWAVAWTGTPPADQDRVTTFWYDGLSNVTKRTAHLNDGSKQVTQYVYGTTLGSSSNTMDSLVRSSTLLAKVHYPNESTGAVDTSSAYTMSYAYNRLGELRGTTDQNGTVHKLTRDDLGRITSDEAETLGTNIDGAVREITASFDDHGRINEIESLNGSSTVLNGVKFAYTPLHQIEKVYQEHSGSVVPSGGSISEYVQYGYTDAAPSASGGNYSRITEVYYPSDVGSDETLSFDYTGETDLDVINDRISRIFKYTATSWNPTTPPDLVKYQYIGQGLAAKVVYPEAVLDSTKGYSGASTSGQYPGFDQYGRRVWHAWVDESFGPGDGTYSGEPNHTPLMARQYAYDAMSNRILDVDGRPGAVAQDRDWEYEYDGLDRLETATRGLRDSASSPTSVGTIANYSRQWTLDMLGNWNNVITDIDSDGLFEGTDDQEDREFNAANEVEVRDLPSGSSFGTTSVPMEYDNAGNFRSNEAVGGADLEYTHDAWSRMVEVEKVLGSGARTTILKNTFNGLNWRIARQVDLSKGSYDGLDEKREYFYSAGWQMIEEYVDTDNDDDYDPENSDDYMSQQIWGARYIDDAVAKRITDDSASRSYYYLTDAMFSVRAITNSSGFVQERIDYTPYGVAMHRFSADVNDDGAINVSDTSAVVANVSGPLKPGDSGYDPDADFNGDGMNALDTGAFSAVYSAQSSNTVPAGWITDPTDSAWTDNSIGYDGYHFDYAGATDATASGLYMVRFRVYDPGLGRWLQRDPLGYVDGMSRFECVSSSPVEYSDPVGLEKWDTDEQNCVLTLSISVRMVWKDNKKPTGTDTWTEARKKAFKEAFKREVENSWNSSGMQACGKSQRIVDNSVIRQIVEGKACRVEKCPCPCWNMRLEIRFERFADFTNDVTANPSGDFIRSFVNSNTKRGSYDEDDVNPRRGPNSQVPASHEFGHQIGLPHPGQYLTPSATPNSPADYDADPDALLGRGTEMREEYYQKWVDKLDEIQSDCGPYNVR